GEEERRRWRSLLRYETGDGPLLHSAHAAGRRRASRQTEERRGHGDGAAGGGVLMAAHTATVTWQRGEDDFAAGHYSRAHEISFDGGITVQGSASPSVVRAPYSREDAVDPEELLVASLSTCHMLWFLDLARRAGFIVDAYE